MSTDSDSPKNKHNRQLDKMIASESRSYASARSTAELELETALATERDGRKEDRFLFILVLIIIFDVWVLRDASTWTLPLVVGVVELFALLIFARRHGVKEIQYWLNQLLPHVPPRQNGSDPPPNSKREDAE